MHHFFNITTQRHLTTSKHLLIYHVYHINICNPYIDTSHIAPMRFQFNPRESTNATGESSNIHQPSEGAGTPCLESQKPQREIGTMALVSKAGEGQYRALS